MLEYLENKYRIFGWMNFQDIEHELLLDRTTKETHTVKRMLKKQFKNKSWEKIQPALFFAMILYALDEGLVS